MKTTAEADEYLRGDACLKNLGTFLKRVSDVETFFQISSRNEDWFLEIDRYGVWYRVQLGWIYEDTGDFMVEATAYYHSVTMGRFAVTDLGNGIHKLRAETGISLLSDISDGPRFGQLIHHRVNQGTAKDLPLVDFTESMVQTRWPVSMDMLASAICRVMLGSMRLAKLRITQ